MNEDEDEDELDPREEARIRRRDHDADAEQRDLMRPGMGKVWKQVTDTWADKAERPAKHGHKGPKPDR